MKNKPFIFSFSVLLLGVFALLISACKKDSPDCPPDLPCATQTGANTLGCYINGVPWVAEYQEDIFPLSPETEAHYDKSGFNADFGNRLRIEAKQIGDAIESSFHLEFMPVVGVETLTNNGASSLKSSLYSQIKKDGQIAEIVFFNMAQILDYRVEISYFDARQQIVSGTFSIVGIGARDSTILTQPATGTTTTFYGLSDTIRITEGRFDVKYKLE